MEQRVSVITLGVRDVARARRFYEALGWEGANQPADEVVFFQAGGMVVSLWDRNEMAAESKSGATSSGFTLAHNVRSPEDVDAVLARAERAGATITGPATRREWGGYSGYFADPDGHLWEVAHNPGWTVNADGTVSMH